MFNDFFMLNWLNFSDKTLIETLKLIGTALAIFLLFWFLRKPFSKYIFHILLELAKKTKSNLDNHMILAFEKPMQIFFIFLGVYLSLSYLPLSSAYNVLLSKFFRSSLIILISMGLYNLSGRNALLCEEIEKIINIKLDKILLPFFSKALRIIIIALTISIIAEEWDYDVNGFIAGLGLGGLAFALAAKDTVSNIFGGLVIILDKPFSIGDWILTSSVEGTVVDINFRSTKIRTFAQALVSLPNAQLANEPITNWTRMGKRRITFKLGITYDTPKDKLEKCIIEIRKMLENHPGIHPETIFVYFDSFSENSLEIFLYFFTNTTNWKEYLEVKEEINFSIMEIIENEGISVAFPSRSVYLQTPFAAAINNERE